MSFQAADRVKISVSSTGTGSFQLGSAVSPAFNSFISGGVVNGSTVHYSAFTDMAFECGQGTYNSGSGTLTRDIIYSSSNANAVVNFTVSPTLIVSPLAESVILKPQPQLGGNLDPNGFGSSNSWNPSVDSSFDLGTPSLNWSSIYCNELVANFDIVVDGHEHTPRRKRNGTFNLYISPTGSDSTGDGTVGNPFKTLQTAFAAIIFEPWDLYLNQCIIHLANGTYPLPPSGFHMYSVWDVIGQGQPGSADPANGQPAIYFVGNTSDSSLVIIDNAGSTASAFNIQNRISIGITGLTIRNCVNVAALNIQGPSTWVELGDIRFQDCRKCIDVGYTATVRGNDLSSFHFTGAFEQAVFVEQGGALCDFNGGTLTFHSTPSFSGAAFEAFEGGVINFSGNYTVVGNFTGNPILASGGHIKSDSFDFSTLGDGTLKTDSCGTYNRVPLGGLGYKAAIGGPGLPVSAGGIVTQLTNKATDVTLNKPCGTIVTSSATLNAGASVNFAFNNSLITTGDLLVINVLWTASEPAQYLVQAACGSSKADIFIRNITAGNLSDPISIKFALIKGVTS